MSSTNKTKNTLAGIVVILAAVVLLIASLVIYYIKNDAFGITTVDLLACILLALCGVIMLFVKIKSYGWAITLSVSVATVVDALSGDELSKILLTVAIAVISLVMLVYKNMKK